jgi:hypothetical protein
MTTNMTEFRGLIPFYENTASNYKIFGISRDICIIFSYEIPTNNI